MTGLRMTDMLSIKVSDFKEDGLHVIPSKTIHSSGASRIFEWDDHGLIKAILTKLKSMPRPVGSLLLFHTSKGLKQNKSCNAFQSMWQRWQTKAI